jgi:hypothetical protein
MKLRNNNCSMPWAGLPVQDRDLYDPLGTAQSNGNISLALCATDRPLKFGLLKFTGTIMATERTARKSWLHFLQSQKSPSFRTRLGLEF